MCYSMHTHTHTHTDNVPDIPVGSQRPLDSRALGDQTSDEDEIDQLLQWTSNLNEQQLIS